MQERDQDDHHGTEGVDFEREQGRGAAIAKYPLNRFVIERATGVIVHSNYSLQAAASWYGPATAAHWHHIPHLRVLPPVPDRDAARQAADRNAGYRSCYLTSTRPERGGACVGTPATAAAAMPPSLRER